MLFCPPHPPVPVAADRPVVLGRSRASDMRVLDRDASRRHAEVIATEDGGGFQIRDLGSTNGTYVNGRRVETSSLAPGDRIQLGSTTVTFCEVGDAVDRPGDTHRGDDKTILVERRVPSEVFRGELSEIPCFAVLQTLEMGRKTGALRIDTVGTLWLGDGRPVHAETKEQRGFDAAVAIVNDATGRFTFEPQDQVPDPTINASVTELLLEASRIQDEAR